MPPAHDGFHFKVSDRLGTVKGRQPRALPTPRPELTTWCLGQHGAVFQIRQFGPPPWVAACGMLRSCSFCLARSANRFRLDSARRPWRSPLIRRKSNEKARGGRSQTLTQVSWGSYSGFSAPPRIHVVFRITMIRLRCVP